MVSLITSTSDLLTSLHPENSPSNSPVSGVSDRNGYGPPQAARPNLSPPGSPIDPNFDPPTGLNPPNTPDPNFPMDDPDDPSIPATEYGRG
jgi:hypothetical protein